MTQTLSVEYQELMARADEIEQPLPAIPSFNPPGPCRLSFVNDAAAQIALNADSMRLYLRACEREWRNLAKSLRNAAKAYEEVDEAAAEDIDAVDNGSGSGGLRASGVSMLGGCEDETPWVPPPPPPPPPPFQYPYYEVRQAATDIETGDQGAAFKAFAQQWDAFQRALQRETYRFRPFTAWEGEARLLVEMNFDAHRQWIYAMTALCVTLGNQALKVTDAHKKARVMGQHRSTNMPAEEHPTSYEVSQCDYWYKFYTQQYTQYLYMAIEWYEKLQQQSETSLRTYVANASMPLAPVNPKTPPTAASIAPPPPKPKPDPDNPDNPDNPDILNPDIPIDGLPDGGISDPSGGVPQVPQVPTMPMTPSTAAADAKLADALKGLKDPKGGVPGGMKPAGVGGGGAGGAGIPKMPLGASPGTGVASQGGAAPGGAGVGGGVPGVGGAAGAGGGGMPMGGAPGGQGGKNEKGKRGATEDAALYTEDREWTEGVIGRRRAKDAKD